MRYVLYPNCNDGFLPQWGRDPTIRPLRQGERRGDIIVTDRKSAAQAYAALLARRHFGRNAKAKFVQFDGETRDRPGSVYCVHVYTNNQNRPYRGEQIRFMVVDQE